jgi:hypothetical protein
MAVHAGGFLINVFEDFDPHHRREARLSQHAFDHRGRKAGRFVFGAHNCPSGAARESKQGGLIIKPEMACSNQCFAELQNFRRLKYFRSHDPAHAR